MKICSTFKYWKGTPTLNKKKCLCPLTEGETFVNWEGITLPTDSCSRWCEDTPKECKEKI